MATAIPSLAEVDGLVGDGCLHGYSLLLVGFLVDLRLLMTSRAMARMAGRAKSMSNFATMGGMGSPECLENLDVKKPA